MNTEQLLLTAIHASIKAGEAIIEVYNSPSFEVEIKNDKSPLTIADKKSHSVITELLSGTNFPVLSEEGKNIAYHERKAWDYFWMIDPLDGTKEFIKRNGEFTVNIALIHDQKSILGVIYVPVLNTIYFGAENYGAFKCEVKNNDSAESIIKASKKIPILNSSRPFTIVASRSHMSPETETFISELEKKHKKVNMVSSGSSIKLCLVAEGAADVYPRFAPTMEWDTAAGQAIAQAAGKKVTDYSTQKNMLYNKENLLNNWFIVE